MNRQDEKRWWQYGYVWLILAGPLAVIIASFITLNLALKTPDAVVDDYYRKGIEINKTLSDPSLAPAQQARNHAATAGGVEH
ncbi:hypothetical protein MTYP_02532 [Methylophilaceae bacterium]|nr:hypothetical protein MTYP_02532 [Methylophilaceae bacterium]